MKTANSSRTSVQPMRGTQRRPVNCWGSLRQAQSTPFLFDTRGPVSGLLRLTSEEREAREERSLAPLAIRSAASRGRGPTGRGQSARPSRRRLMTSPRMPPASAVTPSSCAASDSRAASIWPLEQ